MSFSEISHLGDILKDFIVFNSPHDLTSYAQQFLDRTHDGESKDLVQEIKILHDASLMTVGSRDASVCLVRWKRTPQELR